MNCAGIYGRLAKKLMSGGEQQRLQTKFSRAEREIIRSLSVGERGEKDPRVACLGDESSRLKGPTRTDPLIFLPGCLLRDERSSKCRRRSAKKKYRLPARCLAVTAQANSPHKVAPCVFLGGCFFFSSQVAVARWRPGCSSSDRLLTAAVSAAAERLRRCRAAAIPAGRRRRRRGIHE